MSYFKHPAKKDDNIPLITSELFSFSKILFVIKFNTDG